MPLSLKLKCIRMENKVYCLFILYKVFLNLSRELSKKVKVFLQAICKKTFKNTDLSYLFWSFSS